MRLHLDRRGSSHPDRRTLGTHRPGRGPAVLTAVNGIAEAPSGHDPAGDPSAAGTPAPVATAAGAPGRGVIAVRRITTSSLALSAAELA